MKLGRIVFSVLAMFGLFAGQVATYAQGGGGLQVSPTKTELTVAPGESETFNVQITNVTSAPLTAKPEAFDFEPQDDGSPKLITQENASKSSASIKGFLGGLQSQKLAAGEKTTFNLTVSIPKGQAAGSYYGVILFNAVPEGQEQTANETTGGKVALSASVGHIVLVQVPGDVTDKMQLVNVVARRKVDNNITTGSIFSAVPNQLQITVRNTGNSILRPFGNVVVEKGGKQVAGYQINASDPKATVLPNSNRIFTDELKDLKGFGRFTITANVAYGNGGDILTQKLNVWVVPVWLGVSIGVGVLALAAVVFFMVRKFKK